MKNKLSLSFFTTLFCCIFLLYSPFLTKKWNNGGFGAVICWDVYGYYLYLPSFFYDDLGQLNNYDYIHKTYHPGGDTKDQAFIQPNTGKYVMNYSCGKAILDLPAFAAGHLGARIAGYKADGFTLPYQVALSLWCVIVACAGLWLMRKLLLRYFDDWLVAIVVVTIGIGTNFYNYTAFSQMTHVYLFTIYALIILLTDSFYRYNNHHIKYALAIGLLSGLATITRPTDIICVIIPVLWGVDSIDGLRRRVSFFAERAGILFFYVLGAFIAALPQLIYWHIYAGHWLFFSYHSADATFHFLHPNIINVLFSYKKGWLIYTPVMALSILGFYQLYKNFRQLFWCIALFIVVNTYLVSSWNIWWYAGFSMRALIQSYPLLMFPMAAFLNDMLRKKYLQFFVSTFLLFCIWLNLLMTYQANGPSKYGMMDEGNMTRSYYWRIFGKTDVTLKDKRLLDEDEEMPENLESGLKELYKLPADDKIYPDSTIAISGRKAVRLDTVNQYFNAIRLPVTKDIKSSWFRVYCDVFFSEKEYNWWNQTQFKVQLLKNKKVIKEEMLHIQRITDQGSWQTVFVEIKAPHKDIDTLDVSFWSPNNNKVVYINNVRIDYVPY